MKHFIFYYKRKPLVAVPLDGGFKVAFSGLCCLPATLINENFLRFICFLEFYFTI